MARVVVVGGLGIDTWSLASSWAAARGFEAVNPGSVYREHVQRRTSFGVQLKAFMDAGDLVSETLVGEIVLDAVRRAGDEWMLHGWPRTVAQAEFLAEQGQQPTAVIELSLDEAETMARLGRKCLTCRTTLHVYYRLPAKPGVCDLCGGRLGQWREDAVELIRGYHEATAPRNAHYRARGLFHVVSALGDIEDVTALMSAIV